MLVNFGKKAIGSAATGLQHSRTSQGAGPAAALLSRRATDQHREARPQTRSYRHWWRCTPDEFGLPAHSMPLDIKELIKDPNSRQFDFMDHYWYWRVRKEATILNPERLVKLSYKQLAFDMGMPVVNKAFEHQVGLIELYEYLKSSPMIGPFGTVENPVIIPAVSDIRCVGCTGGVGDDEHYPLWFNCREGFLYRCGECDQVFMLVRITYGNAWVEEDFLYHKEMFEKDPDVDDIFDISLLDQGHKRWNQKDMLRWSIGAQAMGTIPTPLDATEYKFPEMIRD